MASVDGGIFRDFGSQFLWKRKINNSNFIDLKHSGIIKGHTPSQITPSADVSNHQNDLNGSGSENTNLTENVPLPTQRTIHIIVT